MRKKNLNFSHDFRPNIALYHYYHNLYNTQKKTYRKNRFIYCILRYRGHVFEKHSFEKKYKKRSGETRRTFRVVARTTLANYALNPIIKKYSEYLHETVFTSIL